MVRKTKLVAYARKVVNNASIEKWFIVYITSNMKYSSGNLCVPTFQ
jgi:hypothetical protein